MSNRLTFSLASLIFLIALGLVFVPTSVMAAAGGPTVTLAEYSGVEAPQTDPTTQTGAANQHTQARDDFRVKLTFSHPVAAPAAADVQVRWRTAGAFEAPTAVTAIVEVFESNGREYVVTLPSAPGATTTQAHVSIANDVVLGNRTNLLGNVGNSRTFTLPPLNTGTVNLAAPKAVTGTPGAYTIVATFDSGQTTNAHTLSTAFTDDTYVNVEPENAATVTVGAEDASVTGKLSYPLTVQLTYGATNVRVSIDPGYVKGSNTRVLPPPPAPTPVTENDPAARIKVSGLNETARTFRVEVTFTPAAKSDGSPGSAITGFDSTKLDIKDAGDGTVVTTVEAERKADNSYTAILKYDQLSTLPLTVKVKQSAQMTSNPDHSGMVGMAPSTNNAPVFDATSPLSIMGMVGTAITTVDASAADADGDTLAYSWDVTDEAALGLMLDTATGMIAGTPLKAHTMDHTVTVMDGNGGSATLTVSVAITAATNGGNGGNGGTPGMPIAQTDPIIIPTANSSSGPINVGARFSNTMIPAYGFAVLVRDMGSSGIYAPTQGDWLISSNTSLPDLAWFFGGNGGVNTGTIELRGPGSPRDLVISEIMWGTDSSKVDPSTSQWIEFYNATNAAIDLSNFTINFHRSLAFPNTSGAIDVVSNVGHVYFGESQFPGSSGRSQAVDSQNRFAQPMNLVSMRRDINHVGVKHFGTGNRGERDKRIGGWKDSLFPTANIAPYHVATPGTEQLVRQRIGNTTLTQRIIINEIGNSNNDAHDWFEMYNTTNAGVNIENWELTRVYKDGNNGKEVRLARFPKITIPANSYVVIAASNPENSGNDLAAGIDLARGDADQRNKGLGSKPDSKVAYYLINSGVKFANDTNRYLYILRNAKDKLGQSGHVEDVVGMLSIGVRGDLPSGFTGYSAASLQIWDTAAWPLQGQGGHHGDVVHDAGPEDFRNGLVFQRNGKNSGRGEHHLSVRGYTGIGYDRLAANNSENGGTPGYSNGALKGDKSNWAGQVSFSEIMLATHTDATDGRVPRATRLPQWLEIYNSSKSEGVSLNNWYLEIQNADTEDLDTRDLHGTLRLPNIVIPPNQTVLIVSSAGLNSGQFPDQRLINLYLNGTYRSILTITARGDSVLSQVGFYIELRDHKGNHVDEIGNLNVRSTNRRRGTETRDVGNFNTLWDIPSMITDDGHRTSLIRIYDDGVPRDGLNPVGGPNNSDTSWIFASNTNFRRVPSLTYYGNHLDYGTPGYRGGGPLPVQLSTFRPQRLDDGTVVIRWVTESELNNAGFNILRSDTRDGEFTKINTELIAGNGTTSERNAYEFTDKSAKPNVVYYYQIQDVSVDGDIQILKVTHLRGHVSATGKATTTWGKLKALQ